MSDPVRFLGAFAQALAGMALYADGHPQRERAIDAAFTELQQLQRDPRVRCVVLTGAGRAFSSGQDLGDLKKKYSDPGHVNGHVELSPLVWEFLRRSLWAVVNESGGTGAAARIPGLEVAGKTGTAQMIAKSKSSLGQDHAWFAAFAPVKEPEVVVVVLVERGGHGGDVAAPIARRILQAIFLEKVAALEIRD